MIKSNTTTAGLICLAKMLLDRLDHTQLDVVLTDHDIEMVETAVFNLTVAINEINYINQEEESPTIN